MSNAYAQDIFLADAIPAVPAHMVFNVDWIPSMPCTTSVTTDHREKNPAVKSCSNAMVTRPVTRKEMMSNPKAMEAFMKAWKGLWDQEVFDFCSTREYDDVVAEAKKKAKRSIWLVCMDLSMRRTTSSRKTIQQESSKDVVSS